MADKPIIDSIMRWVPMLVVATGLIGTAVTAQVQIKSNQEEIDDLSESIDENEELLLRLRENDIRTDGRVSLEVQGLKSEIANQSAKIDQLILLLRQDSQ